jgi:predicted small lipoprotein YifL
MPRTGISTALVAVSLILLLAVAGCGKKGALYLPDQPRPGKKAQKSADAPSPAAPAAPTQAP